MVIATFPYDTSSPGDTSEKTQHANRNEESGVEVHFNEASLPEDSEASYSSRREKPRFDYDVWLEGALKKQETASTANDNGMETGHHGRIYEKSGWRIRRNRRRKIFAIIAGLGMLMIVISISMIVLAMKNRDDSSVSASSSSNTEVPTDQDDTISSSSSFPTGSPMEPMVNPTPLPTGSPVESMVNPTPRPPISRPPVPIAQHQSTTFEETIVLESNQFLQRGDFVDSPNKEYEVGLSQSGNFILRDRQNNILFSTGASPGERLSMQTDGNLVMKSSATRGLWSSKTHGNPGSVLMVDDGGMVSIVTQSGTKVWLHGVPRGVYDDGSSFFTDLSFPTRGIFYYPWFPATFTVNGAPIKFESNLGRYSSSDPVVARTHIDAMEYAHINLSIASWWGPDTNLERARLTMMMDESIAMGSELKWSVYHEDERHFEPPPVTIRRDMDYLKKWFAWHPAWAHVDGRPVIFVFNAGDCDVVNRWMDASDGDWYVVLKLFPKSRDCPRQPDHWHQYGVHNGEALQYDGLSFSIAPGFWKADEDLPRTPRVGREKFCENAKSMAASDEPWHLIISFNEAGEGTNIEPSPHWASSSGYGDYLDCLHQFPTVNAR